VERLRLPVRLQVPGRSEIGSGLGVRGCISFLSLQHDLGMETRDYSFYSQAAYQTPPLKPILERVGAKQDLGVGLKAVK
jgi:hypothetical protein